MSANHHTTAANPPNKSIPSLWDRAKMRLNGNRQKVHATTSDSIPAAVSNLPPIVGGIISEWVGHQAEMTSHPAVAPKAASIPNQGAIPASKAATFRNASKAGKYSMSASSILIGCLSAGTKASEAEQAIAANELLSRGFSIAAGKVTLTRAAFDGLNSNERNDVMRSGVSLSADTNPNPTGFASGRDLVFPESTGKLPRTWQQFMNLSSDQVKKLYEDTTNERFGRDLRIELFDAWCSMSPASWRNPNQGSSILSGQQTSLPRAEFREKFAGSLGNCNRLGPWEETPNDPAPPVSPNAMTAKQFLELHPSHVEALWGKMREKFGGRNIRAELKRAYRDGSSAEKFALMTDFSLSLSLFPDELI